MAKSDCCPYFSLHIYRYMYIYCGFFWRNPLWKMIPESDEI